MTEYLAMYGWHFSKKLFEHACSRMKRHEPGFRDSSLEIWDRQKVQDLLRRFAVNTSDHIGYDAEYVMNMARADFYGTSITDEQRLAYFVQDYLSDPDGYDEVAMTRYYADCIGRGEQIPWEDVL